MEFKQAPAELLAFIGQIAPPCFLVDSQDVVVAVNGAGQEVVDKLGVQVVGDTVDQLVSDWDVSVPVDDAFESIADPVSRETRDIAGLGNMQVQIVRLYQTAAWYHVVIFDVDEQHGVLDNHGSAQRLQILTDYAPIGIMQTDSKLNCTYSNAAWSVMSGLTPEQSAQMGWLGCIDENDKDRVLAEFAEGLAENAPVNFECRVNTPLSQQRWVSCTAQPLHKRSGALTGFLVSLRDMTSFHKAQETLRTQAYYDGLTKLPNRTLLRDRLSQACRRTKREGGLALALLDLDGFKEVNETYGHDAGDQMLVLVSQRIQKSLREHDTVARLGGDEFIILAEDINDVAAATLIIEKIIETLSEPYELFGNRVFSTVSAGITFVTDPPSDHTVLLRQADIAMYTAKCKGRNQYVVFQQEQDDVPFKRISLTAMLHQAIKDESFQLHYQPQINVNDHSIFGYEALLRLHHPDRGWISPSQFVPVLEEIGLIHRVGEWVLHKACEQFQSWRDQHLISPECRLSVNLSPQQLWRKDIVDITMSALKASTLPAQCLALEITESVVLQNSELSRKILEELRALGVAISLDDFGTGYSSLSYLKQFPFDEVKIDRSFVRDLLVDPDDAAIISAIIGLAKSFGLTVVAEGVDSSEKCRFLKEQGCVIHQGYYFGYPISINEQFNKEQWNEIFRVNPLL